MFGNYFLPHSNGSIVTYGERKSEEFIIATQVYTHVPFLYSILIPQSTYGVNSGAMKYYCFSDFRKPHSNNFAPEFLDLIRQSVSANFEDAIEHAEIRRAQSPVLYNAVRVLEGPLPNLELSANDEIDPLTISDIKEEEIVKPLNADDRNELNGLLSTDDGLLQPTGGDLAQSNENNIDQNTADNEQHALATDLLSDETAASTENAGVSAPELTAEHDISVRNELVAAEPPNGNLDDNEIEFIGDVVEMPKPMESLRNGMVKYEDDDISGNLCYKITV